MKVVPQFRLRLVACLVYGQLSGAFKGDKKMNLSSETKFRLSGRQFDIKDELKC